MSRAEHPQHLGIQIGKTNHAIGKYFANCWKGAEMEPTKMQCATMYYMVKHKDEDIFQKDLENAFGITGATMTNILKLMEKDGLIEKKSVPSDKRLKKLQLTEKGEKLEERAKANIRRLEDGMVKNFSEEEIALCRDFLDRIAQNIDELVEKN